MNTSQSIDDAAHEAQVDLHTEHRVAAIDERIFSGFLEHMGRAVYQGVFDPDSPLSDERGFRRGRDRRARSTAHADGALPGRELRVELRLARRCGAPRPTPPAPRLRVAVDRDEPVRHR